MVLVLLAWGGGWWVACLGRWFPVLVGVLGRLVSLCRRVVCALGRPLPRWLACLRSVFFLPGALPLGFSAFVLARKRLEEVFASKVEGDSAAFSKAFSEIFDLVPRCGLALGTPFSPAWSSPSVAWPYLFFYLNGHAALPLSHRLPPEVIALCRHSSKTSCLGTGRGDDGEPRKLVFA